MNSTLTFQHGLTDRRFAHLVSTSVAVAHAPVAYQATTRSCCTGNPIATLPSMAWRGGIGSTENTSEVVAPKRTTTRPLAEALT